MLSARIPIHKFQSSAQSAGQHLAKCSSRTMNRTLFREKSSIQCISTSQPNRLNRWGPLPRTNFNIHPEIMHLHFLLTSSSSKFLQHSWLFTQALSRRYWAISNLWSLGTWPCPCIEFEFLFLFLIDRIPSKAASSGMKCCDDEAVRICSYLTNQLYTPRVVAICRILNLRCK